MFALDEQDMAGLILGAGDGPASFNAEMRRRGRRVVSCDPIHAFRPEEIEGRIAAAYEKILAETWRNRGDYTWDAFPSLQELGRKRMAAMQEFLGDYRTSRFEWRYVAAALPRLPFLDGSFDLALCSHLLFLYTEQLDEDLHVRSVRELARVAREIRIFPVNDLQRRESAHLAPVMRTCQAAGWQAGIERVPYEFQRGSHRMLRIRTSP